MQVQPRRLRVSNVWAGSGHAAGGSSWTPCTAWRHQQSYLPHRATMWCCRVMPYSSAAAVCPRWPCRRDATAAVASGVHVSKGSLVGRGSTVDAGARLERSVVGSECHVGRGTALQGSCLHARVRVDDSCTVSAALLGEQVVVRSHAKVEVRMCRDPQAGQATRGQPAVVGRRSFCC